MRVESLITKPTTRHWPLKKMSEMIEKLELEPYKKTVLQERYLDVVDIFQRRANRLTLMFYGSRIIMTVGSILVPAFLSIQNSTYQTEIYWTTWILSVFVTLCNGLVTLFKLDKKYFFIHTTLELLKSEGWQYIGLSGRYSSKGAIIPPTHENQFLVFFQMAEKIKMRQVEEEYWKFTDTSGVGNATNQAPMAPLQTPDVPQNTLATFPTEKRKVLQSWMQDLKGTDTFMEGLSPRVDGTGSPRPGSPTANTTRIPIATYEVSLPMPKTV